MLSNVFATAGGVSAASLRPTSDAGVEARLARSFAAATAQRSEQSLAALRAAATDLVDRLKADGLSLHHVMTVVERLLGESGPAPWVSARPAGAASSQASGEPSVYARVLGWCIRAYRDDAWW
jgi:hypothetical protein